MLYPGETYGLAWMAENVHYAMGEPAVSNEYEEERVKQEKWLYPNGELRINYLRQKSCDAYDVQTITIDQNFNYLAIKRGYAMPLVFHEFIMSKKGHMAYASVYSLEKESIAFQDLVLDDPQHAFFEINKEVILGSIDYFSKIKTNMQILMTFDEEKRRVRLAKGNAP